VIPFQQTHQKPVENREHILELCELVTCRKICSMHERVPCFCELFDLDLVQFTL
jgi:hypothetical protein